jgi:hypothetical protein
VLYKILHNLDIMQSYTKHCIILRLCSVLWHCGRWKGMLHMCACYGMAAVLPGAFSVYKAPCISCTYTAHISYIPGIHAPLSALSSILILSCTSSCCSSAVRVASSSRHCIVSTAAACRPAAAAAASSVSKATARCRAASASAAATLDSSSCLPLCSGHFVRECCSICNSSGGF